MAALASPVELPTSRHSWQHVETGDDIKNPQWIPVLRKIESQYDHSQEKELSPYTGASFSPIPTYTTDSSEQRPKPPSVHSHSRSSVAPESVIFEPASPPPSLPLPPLPPIPQQTSRHTNFELPATRPTSRYYEKAHITGPSGDATLASTNTETTVEMSRSESNAGTSTTTDDATSVTVPTTVQEETPLPRLPAHMSAATKEETPLPPPPPPEEDTPSLYPRSTRSSFSSTKKYSIGPPTSKFNRKPSPALPPRVTSLQSETTGAPIVPTWKTAPSQSRTETPAASPRLTPAQPPEIVKPSPSTSSNKTSSPRSRRSNASLSSHSSSDNSAPPPLPSSSQEVQQPTHRLRKSNASVQSQPAKSELKTLTPSLPLTIPVDREGKDGVAREMEASPVVQKPEMARIEEPEGARLAPQPKPGPSTGISSFMTANDTIIFRRFDEVHVQLLLCLQDEITQLERELMRLESAVLTRSDRDIERNRVLRELRKVVVEYDHLFSSWSQMQASKASKSTQQSLRSWLERPSTSAGAALQSQDELKWLDESKDLSAVSLKQQNHRSGGGGVSSFMGGICGKRK